jgi:hypothetical protein
VLSDIYVTPMHSIVTVFILTGDWEGFDRTMYIAARLRTVSLKNTKDMHNGRLMSNYSIRLL